jgi:hypothetical protein
MLSQKLTGIKPLPEAEVPAGRSFIPILTIDSLFRRSECRCDPDNSHSVRRLKFPSKCNQCVVVLIWTALTPATRPQPFH